MVPIVCSFEVTSLGVDGFEVRKREGSDGANQSTRSRPSGVYGYVNNRERNEELEMGRSAPVSFLLHLFFIFEIGSKGSVLCVLLHTETTSLLGPFYSSMAARKSKERGVFGFCSSHQKKGKIAGTKRAPTFSFVLRPRFMLQRKGFEIEIEGMKMRGERVGSEVNTNPYFFLCVG